MINHAIRKDLLERDYTYRRLHGEHQKIEHEIDILQKHPRVDPAYLRTLKQQKLRLKDCMHEIEETVH